jgi:CDGSH-type Zn-finger protein
MMGKRHEKHDFALHLHYKKTLFFIHSKTNMSAKITIRNHGSIRVEGDFELFDGVGNKFDLTGKPAISLCRCGESLKKPFCDGAHKACNFESEVFAVQEIEQVAPKTFQNDIQTDQNLPLM